MKITIIEDDYKLAENLAKRLKKESYLVSIYTNSRKFIDNFQDNSDVFIIDINLEGKNEGFKIIKWLRNNKNISSPILITSGYNNIEKKVYGLDLGADDYLQKPYSITELIARIRSVTRRESQLKNNIINYKKIQFDIKSKTFISGISKEMKFSKKELMLIELFLLNINRVITRAKLVKSIWGDFDGTGVSDNNLNVTLYNLRNKVGKYMNIETIVGEGFILKN
ncbi:MAG: response regulator transcription factor [Candidatus Gracilibacteria bacterium]|nr:response regulator transcription factor [Candidatus Gracilibacteria bacterium]